MKLVGQSLELSATDLVGHLNCRYLTELDLRVARGLRAKPSSWDPLAEVLKQRGLAHEGDYLRHLEALGNEIVTIPGTGVSPESISQTLAAMKAAAPVIAQAAITADGWNGRADVLLKVEFASTFGPWSYEPVDTKLGRETKAGSVLQLCLYADILSRIQGVFSEKMHIIVPWSNFVPETYRFDDYAAYFRKVKRAMAAAIEATSQTHYPEPNPHCEVCRWDQDCDRQRRRDDHLSLVAGISKLQIEELATRSIETVEALGRLELPIPWKPDRGAVQTYLRIREQARLQVESRGQVTPLHEVLPIRIGYGLCSLPPPSPGDIFFDLEGDPFVGEHGLEFLFGYQYTDKSGAVRYVGEWALDRNAEMKAFENFVDFVFSQLDAYPELHIYHYAPYEPAALKRLMGRYATKQDEIDHLLRSEKFIDLYRVVRNGIRAGVESYSIKKLEPLYNFTRQIPLSNAGAAMANLQASLELQDGQSVTPEIKDSIIGYNADDCRSAYELRSWLESVRRETEASGKEIPRPKSKENDGPSDDLTEWQARVKKLTDRLTRDLAADPAERTADQQARWVLANLIDWHRREDKSTWWEYFRLSALSTDELIEERAAVSGLTFVEPRGGKPRTPIHRYAFPTQETDIRPGDTLICLGGEPPLGTVEWVSPEGNLIDIRKTQKAAALNPQAAFSHKIVRTRVLAESLFRLGEDVAEGGLGNSDRYRAAYDLLLRIKPRLGDEPMLKPGESPVDAAVRLTQAIQTGIFAIQGPPGAGKTYTGARMICALAAQGKTIGITGTSHKVIRNLINETIRAANEIGLDRLKCCQKPDSDDKELDQERLRFVRENEDLLLGLGNAYQVAGATPWLWSAPEAAGRLDVLFVDEAAQMSLANVLAVSQAARLIVLIGDPQQLEQPSRGSHPDGTGVSAMHHLLNGAPTISEVQGLFLGETWRLHPKLCEFTSELFYVGRLHSKEGLERQVVDSTGPIQGAGLFYLPVVHQGNQNSSPEEAEAIRDLVGNILDSGSSWIDRKGEAKAITLNDILIITPYNAQVFEIGQLIPGARVGTVDKFQGQEAPIAIYSTATSTHADSPRGMEFLYSLNRLNVATSRARCASILVGSPALLDADCRTPKQMRLANAFCRYHELAQVVG